MAIKKKSPLYKITDPTDPDYVEGTDDTETTDENLMEGSIFDVDITKYGGGVRSVDTSGVDEYISQIETPTGTSVWEKQAAYYRQKGEGDVLRMQKDIASLFQPAITLWQEREALANEKFEALKQGMPEFDTSKIFGDQSDNPMPVVDEIKAISTSVRADMRELSRLNINDPRYDELRKKIEKDQKIIEQFSVINDKLIAIKNDIGTDSEGNRIKLGNDQRGDWSKSMSEEEIAMWTDIYNGNGENIKVIDGKLMWVPEGKVSYEFKDDPTTFDTKQVIALGGKETTLGGLAYYSKTKTGEQETFKTGQDNATVTHIQRRLKKLYPDHDFGNEKWGPKTQAAYDKYLNEKDELETKWLDENLSEDEKEKYQKVTTGENIDLSTIPDGPKMVDGVAWRTMLSVSADLYTKVAGGANPNSSNPIAKKAWDMAIINAEDGFDSLGRDGQFSLLIDGFYEQRDKKSESDIDVKPFLNDFMQKINVDFKNMNEEQQLDEIDKLRRNGMDYTYTTEDGKKVTLGKEFKDYYMGELKSIAITTPRTTTEGGGGGGGGTGKTSGVTKGKIAMKGGVYYNMGGAGNRLGSDVIVRFNSFAEGKEFRGYGGGSTYTPISVNQWKWTSKDGKETKTMTSFEVADVMGFNNQSHMLGYDSDALRKLGEPDPKSLEALKNPFVGKGGAVIEAPKNLISIIDAEGDTNGEDIKKWLLKEYPGIETIFNFETDGEEITISIPGTSMTKVFTGDPYRGVFYDADKNLGNAIMKYLKESFDAWKTAELGKISSGDIDNPELNPE